MNQEFLSATSSQEVLEKNLIVALTRLQDTAFDTEFLDTKDNLLENLPPEPFLGFVIGSHSFIVHAKYFCEVFADTHVAALPNAPACVVGLSNIRGVLIPVYQLHSFLNTRPPQKITIFCIGKGDSAIGILIDGLPASFSLSHYQRDIRLNCKEAVLNPLIQASYTLNDTAWLLIDGNKFAEQLQTLANQILKSPSSTRSMHESVSS